jgi:hypothetical protein
MGFQKGNQLAVGAAGNTGKTRLCTQNLISELNEAAKTGSEKGVPRIRKIVKKMCDLAEKGDKEMIFYIFNRIDGQMAQPLPVLDDPDGKNGPLEFTLRIGTQAADGSRQATELNVRPAQQKIEEE